VVVKDEDPTPLVVLGKASLYQCTRRQASHCLFAKLTPTDFCVWH